MIGCLAGWFEDVNEGSFKPKAITDEAQKEHGLQK